MSQTQPGDRSAPLVVAREGLDALFLALTARGYTIVGPTVRDGAIAYGALTSTKDLPEGWGDEQEGGTYRLRRRDDSALFGYTVGPDSWKKYLFPPSLRLWDATRAEDGGFEVEVAPPGDTAYAFIGVRACELAAIRVQDKVFLEGPTVDPAYEARRRRAFIVAVNCGTAAATCFCTSMGTGPGVESGYDLALTELIDGDAHRFVVEVGSDAGAAVMGEVPHVDASEAQRRAAAAVTERAMAEIGRAMDTTDIKALLYRNYASPSWDEVASRCLSCGNCTLVCPTCFCSSVEDTSDLTGEHAERTRVWDSCFNLDHSYIHGGSIRSSGASRYRQWMTHKLGTWIDQFDTSGCVGCGRCIAWCPVGIDITQEVAAIREQDLGGAGGQH